MMKRLPLLLVLVLLAVSLAVPALAEDASIGLSKQLTCYVFFIFTKSQIGLIIGLLLALLGLWTIIKGQTGWGIATILGGAAVTALPYLVVSFFEGTQQAVSGMTTGAVHLGSVVDDISSESSGFSSCESIHVDMSSYLMQAASGLGSGTGTGYGTSSPVGGLGGDAFTQPASASCSAAVSSRQQVAGPVSGGGRLSSCFGARDRPCPTCSQYHKGIDIAAAEGTAVTAWGDGKVVAAGCNGNCNGTAKQGLGYFVQVDYGNGRIDTYSHLKTDPTSLMGSTVGRGSQIGSVGNTGASTGAHLDYRVQINGKFVDPLENMR